MRNFNTILRSKITASLTISGTLVCASRFDTSKPRVLDSKVLVRTYVALFNEVDELVDFQS